MLNLNWVFIMKLVVINLLWLSVGAPLPSHQLYHSEQLYIIPWGEDPGRICTFFWDTEPDSPDRVGMIDPPGPWAVSETGELVIGEYTRSGARLTKFAADGSMIAFANLASMGLELPSRLAVSPDGTVLMDNRLWLGDPPKQVRGLCLLDSELELANSVPIPCPDRSYPLVKDIFSLNDGGFGVLFSADQMDPETWDFTYGRYCLLCSADGTVTDLSPLYMGPESDPGPMQSRFITPLGEKRPRIEDRYGFTYWGKVPDSDKTMNIYSPEGELVFSHTLVSDSDYRMRGCFYYYCIMWSGDFYTLHASDEGAVLTKYTLVTE